MKIISTKVMKGPNFWSNYRKHIIIMKLDLEELEQSPTNKIKGFSERIEQLIPSMFSHRCSESHEGGFFLRIKEGTWIGHVVEHIALEIQTLAGMDCGYGRTRSDSKEGVYFVIFAYHVEKAGLYAAEAAVRIAQALVDNVPYDINKDIEVLKKLKAKYGLGPSTQSIVEEALERGIPYKRLNNSSMVLFGQGIYQKKIRATLTSSTSHMGVEIACDKNETKTILKSAYIPTPESELVYDDLDLELAVQNVGFPVVIKPINGNHGRGITINIQTLEQAKEAFKLAKEISEDVLVERYLVGADFRFLLINFKLVAVAKRTPAFVIGDGKSTINQLIDETNLDPARGDGHENMLTKIKIDKLTLDILAQKNYTLETIPPQGEEVLLKDTANISTGGTATDVTHLVHPANVFMAERISKLLNMDICGIDVMTENIEVPLTNQNGGVIEVNACPGFRMHLSPTNGKPRNVAAHVVDMLYPQGMPSRIPLVAVTGTNGKTTTTRLIAHMAKQAGHLVGYTTTDGTYIQEHLINTGDCTGPVSAQTVLTDPTIDFAVLECARGGILRAGLGFDNCDISIITNISEDHLSLDGIDTLSDMTRVKSVVAHSTFKHGYAILNADDERVFNLNEELDCNIALFSIEPNNQRVAEHCNKGGLAVILDNGFVTICAGQTKIPVEKINDIPLSMGGKADSMIKNILPAVLTAYLKNFTLKNIRIALKSFIPSPQFTPGRMNLFHFKDFDVMIDYAHNSGGFVELKSFMEKTISTCKIGIIAAVGDRRDEDIRNVGVFASQTFDEIIIRHDKNLRGRTKEELNTLIMEGVNSVKANMQVKVISDEKEALLYAIKNAQKGSFITVCTDCVQETIDYLSKMHQEEIQNSETINQTLLKAS
ncbi:MAG: cyanophycin synthetase [Bacteroidetes bacterium]|nr:cyanophycin synthetase [Bacteroidota bacterium]